MKPPRYLINFDTAHLPYRQTEVLIIGSGISGLRAAIGLARIASRVTIITKDTLTESNTAYAQGGIASHLDTPQLIKSHIQDTLQTGQGLNDPRIVELIIRKGIKAIKELVSWGVKFDLDPKNPTKFALAQEGGHTHPRILHAGDYTGQEILRVLIEKVRSLANIEILEKVFAIDILTQAKRCLGILAYDYQTKKIMVIQAKKTIISTGGCGQLYRETTNSVVATGDGLAMAYRAGAVLQDMEFIQFHPTALYVAGAARALISEAVRGAGGILRDRYGNRFMSEYHPLAELAPRDIVCRAILNQMKLTQDTNVYLDLTHLPASQIRSQFPGLSKLCQTFGIDIRREYIPVRPSAHYMVGGIRIKPNGATNIKALYAIGEVASSGFHGANRLGSNSLLEGLVLGQIVGEDFSKTLWSTRLKPIRLRYKRQTRSPNRLNLEDLRNSLKSLMTREVGIERTGHKLKEVLERINFWSEYVMKTQFTEPAGWELQNLLVIGYLVTLSALKRTESRGTHFRTDYPAPDNHHWQKHITLRITRN